MNRTMLVGIDPGSLTWEARLLATIPRIRDIYFLAIGLLQNYVPLKKSSLAFKNIQ